MAEKKDLANYQMVLKEDGLHVFRCPISDTLVSVQVKDGYPVKLRCDDYTTPKPGEKNGPDHCLINSLSSERTCLFDAMIILNNPYVPRDRDMTQRFDV